MTPTPDPPPGIPELTGEFAEFDYYGERPLIHAARNEGFNDVARLSRAGEWERGFGGRLENHHYAIRRGTELHRLNFPAPPVPVLPERINFNFERAAEADAFIKGLLLNNSEGVFERTNDWNVSVEVPTPTPQQPGRETPRTDAFSLSMPNADPFHDGYVWRDFARTLERETAALSADVARLREQLAEYMLRDVFSRKQEQDLASARGDAERWKAALGLDQPWSVACVLRRLAEAADHLMNDHQCDADRWEEVAGCAKRARDYADALDLALAPAQAEGGQA